MQIGSKGSSANMEFPIDFESCTLFKKERPKLNCESISGLLDNDSKTIPKHFALCIATVVVDGDDIMQVFCQKSVSFTKSTNVQNTLRRVMLRKQNHAS